MISKIEEFYDLVYEIDNKFKRPTNYTEKSFLKNLLHDKKVGNLQMTNLKRIAKKHQKPPLMAFHNFFSKQPEYKIDLVSLLLMLNDSKNLYESFTIIKNNFKEQFPFVEKLDPYDDIIKEKLSNINLSDLKNFNFNEIDSLIKGTNLNQEIEIPKFNEINILDNKIWKDILDLYNKAKNKEINDFEKDIGIKLDLKFIQSEIDHAINYFKKYEETNVPVSVLLQDIRFYIMEKRFKFIFDKFNQSGKTF